MSYIIALDEGTTSTRGEYVVNKWIEFDLSKYNIIVNEGETLVFGDSSDTVHLAYSKEDKELLNFYTVRPIPESGSATNTSNSVAMSFLVDVMVSDYAEISNFADHLEMIKKLEAIAKKKTS